MPALQWKSFFFGPPQKQNFRKSAQILVSSFYSPALQEADILKGFRGNLRLPEAALSPAIPSNPYNFLSQKKLFSNPAQHQEAPPEPLPSLFPSQKPKTHINPNPLPHSFAPLEAPQTLKPPYKPHNPNSSNVPEPLPNPNSPDSPPNPNTEILDLDNARDLFRRLSTSELASALLNLELAANGTAVDMGTAVLRSDWLRRSALGVPLMAAIRRTGYAHFCAGETAEEAAKTLRRMWELGLKGILDFSVEDAHDSETCDRNLDGFLRTIRLTADLPEESVSFACVKVTALCPLSTLSRASSLLRWHHLHPLSRPPWLLPSLPVLAPESPIFHVTEPVPLSAEEERNFLEAYQRLRAICHECEAHGIPLLVDAEYFSVEPAIDHLAHAAALEFNKEVPRVYSTVQCYLKDSIFRLRNSLDAAKKMGIPFGVKLVRGAYLTRESKLAKEMGVESPIFGAIEDTHRCYDQCAAMMLEAAGEGERERGRGRGSDVRVLLATHNYESGRAAAVKAWAEGLGAGPAAQFAQLKGMAEGLSLGLARAGFRVSKYLPYGPLADVMPYLIRRAEENRGVLGNTAEERRRMRSELIRRLRESVHIV